MPSKRHLKRHRQVPHPDLEKLAGPHRTIVFRFVKAKDGLVYTGANIVSQRVAKALSHTNLDQYGARP